MTLTTTDRVTFGYTKTCAIIVAAQLSLRVAIDPAHWGSAGGPFAMLLFLTIIGLPIVVTIDLVSWIRWRRSMKRGGVGPHRSAPVSNGSRLEGP
jgi:hypothetical protein